jgi:NadR type nicotinamide-nucleotide adenylyltransferase
MEDMTRGLVLGKFAPLHRGHQFLIETALAAVDELVVLVYEAADVTSVPLATRAGWLRRLYPRARVIEAIDGPTTAGRDPAIMRAQEQYLLRAVPQPVTHFFSSEWYGEHVSAALGATNVAVDLERRRLPISGSQIRADPFGQRAFLDPLVYRDLVGKIVFLGAECTGKTTLAARMAEVFGTRVMPEHGRDVWERQHGPDGTLTAEQLVQLAREQLQREDALVLESDRFLFVDTNALTTAIYARHYHGRVPPELADLARQAEHRYRMTFVCGDEIPYSEDGTRLGEAQRAAFQRQILDDLDERGVAYSVLGGPLERRVELVRARLPIGRAR